MNINMTLTLLGSTLNRFTENHTEYGSISTLGFTTLMEDEGYIPFKVVLYITDTIFKEYMAKPFSPKVKSVPEGDPSIYPGTYHLEQLDDKVLLKGRLGRVVIYQPLVKKDWVGLRVIVKDGDSLLMDTTEPLGLLRDGPLIDIRKGLYLSE